MHFFGEEVSENMKICSDRKKVKGSFVLDNFIFSQRIIRLVEQKLKVAQKIRTENLCFLINKKRTFN